ncbi:regulator of G-protein signaling 13-like [Trachemys scripta elegans]|uniref:regulator of G-protein signaling 13-like n=1 Tax=Trachemys scripta elegans TaxID=31138 RepID=UPI0015516732|nr:regulator of G-protein signaling 13-like [Trachemys scripta elegans]
MSPNICCLCKLFREDENGITSKVSLEEVLQWSQSFETLMTTKSPFQHREHGAKVDHMDINIDSPAREAIIRNIQEPTQSCFDEAQRIVYMHMERDSYPRFLGSEIYQKLKHRPSD